jgi:hypothetical protein
MKLLAFFLCMMLWSCGGHDEKEKPNPPVQPPQLPGAAVTFSAALPIVQASCWGSSCHNQARPAGGISLADYSSISKNLAKGLASVSAGRMPKGGKSISAAEANTLRQWAIGGYLK